MPHFCFVSLAGVFFFATGSYGYYLGGHAAHMARALLSDAGLVVHDVQVEGNRRISDIEVIERLALRESDSFITLNPEILRKRLSGMAWAKKIAVRKIYPGKIRIDLTEHVPFALWQYRNSLHIVESGGNVLDSSYMSYMETPLPLIVGEGAGVTFQDFFERVRKFPEISRHVKNHVRIGNRRWNLTLDNGVVIKLPEKGIESALSFLSAEHKKTGLLGRDISIVDLRLPGRPVVRLSPDAVLHRRKALESIGIRTAASVMGEKT